MTWREVAIMLAQRLVYQANKCDKHSSWLVGVGAGCPFCQDTAAYEKYLTKARSNR